MVTDHTTHEVQQERAESSLPNFLFGDMLESSFRILNKKILAKKIEIQKSNLPLSESTRLMAPIRCLAFLALRLALCLAFGSLYSTKTSKSFKAVLTTKRCCETKLIWFQFKNKHSIRTFSICNCLGQTA